MFAKAVELDGSQPVHRLEHARALQKLGRYSQAREELRECIRLTPVHWEDPDHQAEAAKMLDRIEGKRDRS